MKNLITGVSYDIGSRENYEDRVAVRQITTPGGLVLTVAIVADGVGGENRGERAAQVAINMALHYLEHSNTSRDVPQLLHDAFIAANQAVIDESKDSNGATTTLTAAAVHKGRLYVANVGDSRVYLCRNGKLSQLTVDHNFANVMPWLGKMSATAAAASPRADVLMRFLGRHQLPVDLGFYVDTSDQRVAHERGCQGLPLRAGDSILVCSDGLIKASANGQPFVTPEEIVQVLTTQEGDKAARSLVSFALGRNVDDNVSVALLQAPDPKRRRRARQPVLRALLLSAIFSLLGLLFISLRLEDSYEIIVEAAQAEQAATETALALLLEAERATGTAQSAALATQNAATVAAEATQRAVTAATAVHEQTRVALAEQCLESAGYKFTINGMILQPARYQHVQGQPLPPDFEIQMRWAITNIGLCSLAVAALFPESESVVKLAPVLQQNGRTLTALLPGETAELIAAVTIASESNLLAWRNQFNQDNAAWTLIVAPRGDDGLLVLVNEPLLRLSDFTGSNPINIIVSPTIIPFETPTPAPTAVLDESIDAELATPTP